MRHRCHDGITYRLTRHGPIGTEVGVTFTCDRCGWGRTSDAIRSDHHAVRDAILATLREHR